MNGNECLMSTGRFAGLSRPAFTRIPRMTVILARRASAVCSIRYIVSSSSVSRIANKLPGMALVRDL